MANTIIAFDELDATLGPFFLACKKDLDVFFAGQEIHPKHVGSAILNDVYIEIVTNQFPKFIFGAYSHGGVDRLVKSARTPYISDTLNCKNFKNSFFYTWSCSSGKTLGGELIKNGCLCFIGYKEEVAIWTTYMKPFIDCANFGLIQFFLGQTTNDIILQMKDKYNQEIDNTYKVDYLIASILLENRDALVLHGEDISIHHLN